MTTKRTKSVFIYFVIWVWDGGWFTEKNTEKTHIKYEKKTNFIFLLFTVLFYQKKCAVLLLLK